MEVPENREIARMRGVQGNNVPSQGRGYRREPEDRESRGILKTIIILILLTPIFYLGFKYLLLIIIAIQNQ